MGLRIKKCFYCMQDIQQGENHRMFPLERPYVNLFFHRGCFDLIKADALLYLTENEKKLYNYISESKNKSQK